MKTIAHIIRKEFIQIRRDRRMLGISILAPVIQLLILGYAANLDVSSILLVVCDEDESTESRNLVATFTNTGYFTLAARVHDARQIDRLLDNGHASFALVIPRGFARTLTAGKTSPVQLIADGTETIAGGTAMNYASAILSQFSQRILTERVQRGGVTRPPPRIEAETRVWYNPSLKSRNFMIPGVLGLLLMVLTMILTSLAIVKEKELGTLEQLVVTPITPQQLMVGKLVPFLIIGMVDVALVVGIATFLFGVPLKGSFLLLYTLCLVFLMTTLGLGLYISTVARTQQQAMMTAMFFIMMPMIFFSGFVFPIENMPLVIQGISYLLPLRYFFEIVRGIFLKGVGMETLWPNALALFAFGVVIMSMSVVRFRKRLG